MAIAVNAKKTDFIYYMHSMVTLTILFGFHLLPPIGPLTSLGMEILGIFLGLVYGWTFVSLIWPSLLGLIALGFTDYTTVKGAFLSGFGNDTLLFALFIFLFAAVVDQTGITKFIATWIIHCKWAQGNPWTLSLMILLAAYILSALVSLMAATIITWRIFYKICDRYRIEMKEKYATLMLIGIAYASMVGYGLFPFKLMSGIILSAYGQLSGSSVDFLTYSFIAFTLGMLAIFTFLLLCRFVFKPDVSALAVQTHTTGYQEHLSGYQKVVLALLLALIVTMFLPSILPESWLLSQILRQMGNTGIMVFFVGITVFLRHQGKPFIDLTFIASKGIVWNVIFLLSAAMPISVALTSEGTGIKAFISQTMTPLFAGRDPLFFSVLLLILVGVMASLIYNIVTGVVIYPIAYTFMVELGADAQALTILLAFMINIALLAPASGSLVALMHSNKEWLSSLDVYKYGAILLLLTLALVIGVGLPLTGLLL